MPSSIQLFTQTIGGFKRIQDSLFTAQSKIGAESKAETFAELGADLSVTQSFKASALRSERFQASINEVSRRLDAAYRAVDDIIEVAIDFKRTLTLENSPNASVNDLTGAANTALDVVRGSLNSRDGANFIFSGSKTNEQPVNDLKQISNVVNDIPTANYYNGDNFIASVDVSKTLNVAYGVTASNPAFQNFIASLNIAKQVENGNQGQIENAGKLLEKSIDELISLRAEMGNNSKIFEQNKEIHSRAEVVFKQKLSETLEPNIVELTIQTNQNQVALTALFQNFAKISNLSLVNFLN